MKALRKLMSTFLTLTIEKRSAELSPISTNLLSSLPFTNLSKSSQEICVDSELSGVTHEVLLGEA
ncbi:hypothetical protein KY284_034564 [Solanum tuberosum]|nr:hypothetical protein KY284_034564 [Solanum tuberosum]